MPQERFRFKCLRCGRCCKDPATIVTVTIADILTLATHLGLGVDELLRILGFYHLSGSVSKTQIEKMVTSPVATEKGQAFVGLLKGEGGKCTFLNDENLCTIYPARPKVCRTFPFTYTALKRLKGGVDYTIKMGITSKGMEYCPGLTTQGAPLVKLQESKKLGAETLVEMEEQARFAKEWNAAVNAGKVQGTARNFVEEILKKRKRTKGQSS